MQIFFPDFGFEETNQITMHRTPLLTNFLRLFLPAAAFVLAGIFFYGQSEIERDASRLMSRETLHVGLGAGTLSRHLEGITRDLTFLASHSALQAAINTPTSANIAHLAEDLANFSRSSAIFLPMPLSSDRAKCLSRRWI